ncbi:DUF6243 family protein [Actinomadura algeriensis]|uniref:Small EDRK-rich factor-like N-terminal domain-containing protein n=1 Tax=Actinomadura algeriensis TaxID=1679523 RepID=A0ABR9JP22_9ACTN|nr:DUF6243 family protein [Actinomadura algeriensis]MBE1531855.1 hypothetical protein [Actinomadura algeriensis]
MAKGRNNMLGVGGQRKNVSRRALRGDAPQAAGNADEQAARKRDLLAKMRERNEERTAEAERNEE